MSEYVGNPLQRGGGSILVNDSSNENHDCITAGNFLVSERTEVLLGVISLFKKTEAITLNKTVQNPAELLLITAVP